MKKLVALFLFTVLTISTSIVFAALTDSRASIVAAYGEARLVIDVDNQLWTKDEWQASGSVKTKAGGFVHYFTRNGVNFQMEVEYESTKPDAFVRAQRFTPDTAIKIKDLKDYFPEIFALTTAPRAQAFGTYKEITRNFQDETSPAKLGIVVKTPVKEKYYTLLAFNIKNAGLLVKDFKNINSESYIHEFTIERILRNEADTALSAGDWQLLKNPFVR